MKTISRIEYLKKRYQKIPFLIFHKLIQLDPTSNHKYSQWILNLYYKNKIKEEDYYKVTDYLLQFEDVKHKLLIKDINRYKTLPNLISVIKNIGGSGKTTIDENYLIADRYYIKNGEAELFAEDENFLIVIPKTLNASSFYAHDTEWCTQYSDSFLYYIEMDSLYIIIDKKKLNTNDINRRLQFHFEGDFMSIIDSPLSYKITKQFIKYFKNRVSKHKLLRLKYQMIGNFKNNIAVLEQDDLCGFINMQGDIIVSPKYENVRDFKGKMAAIKRNSKWGFVNTDGIEVIKPIYEESKDFHDGLAAVKHCFQFEDELNDNNHISNHISNYIKRNIVARWGFINTKGEQIISNKYHYVESFVNGYALASIRGRWRCVDKQGNEYMERINEIKLFDLNRSENYLNQKIVFEGIVRQIEIRKTKLFNNACVVNIEDETDTYRFTLFDDDFETFYSIIKKDFPLKIMAKVESRPYGDRIRMRYLVMNNSHVEISLTETQDYQTEIREEILKEKLHSIC
ncbi:MAG: WG repeat-containing protein [Bacteroidales bacterium]|jgi:hypothetical protein|nr:WG repeat-containing protein [Bacteroidales bacterium]